MDGLRDDTQLAEQLVRGLDDLHRGTEFQLRLVELGAAAIGPLRSMLLGPPALHPQPRILAVEALGLIGGPSAVDALIAALCVGDLASLSPVVKLAEESVRGAIARELARLGDDRAVEPLLDALRRFRLIEAGCALATFGERRAIPMVIDCLADAFVRERAADVLHRFGKATVPALIDCISHRLVDAPETLPRREQRVACARLLGEIGDSRAIAALRPYVNAPDATLRAAAGLALATLQGPPYPPGIVNALIDGVQSHNSSVVDDCSRLLALDRDAATRLSAAFVDEADRAEQGGERVPGRGLRAMARTLGTMGEIGCRALASLCDHPSRLVRGLALASLDVTRAEISELPIVRALGDPDCNVRETARVLARRLRMAALENDRCA